MRAVFLWLWWRWPYCSVCGEVCLVAWKLCTGVWLLYFIPGNIHSCRLDCCFNFSFCYNLHAAGHRSTEADEHTLIRRSCFLAILVTLATMTYVLCVQRSVCASWPESGVLVTDYCTLFRDIFCINIIVSFLIFLMICVQQVGWVIGERPGQRKRQQLRRAEELCGRVTARYVRIRLSGTADEGAYCRMPYWCRVRPDRQTMLMQVSVVQYCTLPALS